MISALPVTADSGTPPASDLAMVIRSGTTPKCSIANSLPVRPKPVWISSAIITMPCSSHSWRSHFTASAWITLKPPSPCTGSKMIAATRLGSMSALKRWCTAFLTSARLAQWQGKGAW